MVVSANAGLIYQPPCIELYIFHGLYYFIEKKVQAVAKARSQDVVAVQVGTERDVEVANVLHVAEAQVDVEKVMKGSEVGMEMVEINEVVVEKDNVIDEVKEGKTVMIDLADN